MPTRSNKLRVGSRSRVSVNVETVEEIQITGVAVHLA